MSTSKNRYSITGVEVSDVRNRNEPRIAKKLEDAIVNFGATLTPQAVRDAYALALNLLPARYKQSDTIVLREPIRESHLDDAVNRALKQVIQQPKP